MADVPKSIEGTLYIDCVSDSNLDFCKTHSMIENILTHRKYAIKKDELRRKTVEYLL